MILPPLHEHIVYHGTKTTDPSVVIEKGFDVSFGRALSGHLWFSESAFYSASGFSHIRENGEHQILRCKIHALPKESVATLECGGKRP
jgi:hypothetical protein